MNAPSDPVAAVTHPDPYPYYAELVARRSLHRDDTLGLWVAASAATVTAVLTSERCRVRPLAEPVPAAIAGSATGEIFGAMIRFNDGARHLPLKQAVGAVTGAFDPARLLALSRATARALANQLRPGADPARVSAFMLELAPSVIGSMLGAPPAALPDIARWTGDFVAATAPGAFPEAVGRGALAAACLRELGASLVTADGLIAALARQAGPADQDRVIANALGFLWQAYDATAGLIGNTLVALARTPELARARDLLPVVAEVARHDAPVQNTRRFVAEDGVVAGEPMKRGETILVLLAAANRDPAANPDPARFDPTRTAPRTLTFGHGPHACPGAVLATTIASAGVETLIEERVPIEALARDVRYRPSANIRIPVFGEGGVRA